MKEGRENVSDKKIYNLILVLMAVAILLGAVYAGSRFRRHPNDGGSNETMIVSLTGKLSECKWNDVAPVLPSQFENAPAAFTAFRKGYHRLGLCPESTLDVNVLEYDDAGKASAALSAWNSIVSSDEKAHPETTVVNVDGRRLKIVKVRGSEGGLLYIAMWSSGKNVLFLEEETSPSYPEGKALKQMRSLLEETYRLYKP